jgi:hypothetical protein
MSKNNKNTIFQELEAIEKFLAEAPEEEIKTAAGYIFEQLKLNLPKLQNTKESFLAPRFLAVLKRVEEYLLQTGQARQEQHLQFFKQKKQNTINVIPQLKPLESKNTPQFIVSLTSYGKRLTDTAPYAIITLLNQSVKPDKIILWVAHADKEIIPAILQELTKKGLDIRFCEDLKSYKKLIFSLQEFPEDYIITADDDQYYPKNWFEQLITLHKSNPEKIICHRAHGIKIDANHNLLPYNNWDSCIEPALYFAHIFVPHVQSIPRHSLKSVFPTGCGGILYPPGCLHKEITNKELFMKLAPRADDVWFWAMAIMNKKYFGEESPYLVIENGYSRNLQVVDPEQMQGGNALWNYNSQGGNDKQLQAVIEYFPEIKDVLAEISLNRKNF